MKIEKIDGNFKVESSIKRDGIKFFDAKEKPFKVCGLMRDGGRYVRMPQGVAASVNDGVKDLNSCTAGGRVRFVTDSPYVAVAVKYNVMYRMPHCADTGSVGFDLYADDLYAGTFIPRGTDTLESVIDLPETGAHTMTIHFPLYGGVDELFIGLKEDATLLPPPDYRTEKPVVFYGSSITQGGCASRPGNAYDNIISRILSCDHVNLGFSGSARGEKEIAEYIASLDMSAFIFDYDHNAPNPEHLEKTHEPMFRVIREAHPDLPVIMLSRPNYHLDGNGIRRMEIIRRTYENAVAAGDKNVYFIPGPELIEERIRECATVDGSHPNDSGFVSMAYAVEKVLKNVL